MSLANATAQAQRMTFRRSQIGRHPNLSPAGERFLNAGEGRIQGAAKVELAALCKGPSYEKFSRVAALETA